MNNNSYAEYELELAGYKGTNIESGVLLLMDRFSEAGHSGASAGFTINTISRIAKAGLKNYKPKGRSLYDLVKPFDYDEAVDDSADSVVSALLSLNVSDDEMIKILELFKLVANWHPITPIYDIPEIWNDVGDELLQCKRCSALFKDPDGQCRYGDAVVWRSQTGSCFSGGSYLKDGTRVRSSLPVKFPFTPKTFYVNVVETEVIPGDFASIIEDTSQLDEVFKYYKKPVDLNIEY